jgi:hypothetical protein
MRNIKELENERERAGKRTWAGEDCSMSWRRLEVDCTACPICSATAAFAPPPPPDAAAISHAVVLVAHGSLKIIRGPAQSTATRA